MKKKILIAILFLLIVALVCITLLFYIYKVKNFNEIKTNDTYKENGDQLVDFESKYRDYSDVTTDEIGREREFRNLKFTSGKLMVNGEHVVFTVIISNESKEDIKLGKFNIVFKDKDNLEVGILVGYAGDVIKSGSEVTPYISSDIKMDNVYTLEYQEYIEK